MSAIAIDLGGTFIKLGLYQNGSIKHMESFPAHSEQGLTPKLDLLAQKIADLTTGSEEDVVGIGMAFPGIVDSTVMRVLSTNKKYRDAVSFNFSKWARSQFGLPIFLESDARSALVGEWKFGSARNCENVVMIMLGTGVGTSAIIQGRLLRGAHYQAGGMGGHFSVNWKGHPCNCGGRGCVEAEASSWRLPDIIKMDSRYPESMLADQQALDFKSVFELADQDELSMDVRNHCLEVWGAAVVNMVHAYDPEMVIMGGGVIKSSEVIIPYLQEVVNSRSWTPWGNVKIMKSTHADSSVLLGAGFLLTDTLS